VTVLVFVIGYPYTCVFYSQIKAISRIQENALQCREMSCPHASEIWIVRNTSWRSSFMEQVCSGRCKFVAEFLELESLNID